MPNGLGHTGQTPISWKRLAGTLIKPLNKTLRHFGFTATEWNVSNLQHNMKVPAGKYWQIIGGYLTRGVCTATAVVDIRSADDTLRRRLLVLASGASDTTDIPDNALRVRPIEIMEEQTYIKILMGGAQNADTEFNISVLEGESKV